jgi:valyl-tRNA synthetase
LKTAISDIEVDREPIDKPTKMKVPGHNENTFYEFGVFVKFAYKLKSDPSKEIIVATTRIETMLGN